MKKIRTILVCSIVGAILCACTSREYLSTSTEAREAETQAQMAEPLAQPTETLIQPTEALTQPVEIQTKPIETQAEEEGLLAHQDNYEDDIQSLEEDDSLEVLQAKLIEVLSGKDTFFSHSYEKNLTIDEYCSTFSAESGITVEITKYTAVDLDQDNVPEVVLWITVNEYSDYGTAVLRYHNGEVEEYTFTYRQMFDLKRDGTFSCSGSEFDGIASLTFHEDGWHYKEMTAQQQSTKESAEWFSYPDDDYSGLFNR